MVIIKIWCLANLFYWCDNWGDVRRRRNILRLERLQFFIYLHANMIFNKHLMAYSPYILTLQLINYGVLCAIISITLCNLVISFITLLMTFTNKNIYDEQNLTLFDIRRAEYVMKSCGTIFLASKIVFYCTSEFILFR